MEYTATAAKELASGWRMHQIESKYQRGQTQVFVRLPKAIKQGEKVNVLYLLPVEAKAGQRWGDAMAEADKHDLANKHNVICVYPTFSHLPWYADHPGDKQIQQESYFLHVVVPFVEREYPAVAQKRGRYLLGFSKSGWGAWSLLLRRPDKFARAAAWDAPLMEAEAKRYGMGPIFGDGENFKKYQITTLLRDRKDDLTGTPRLILTGYDGFRTHHQRMHALLDEAGIPHVYRDGPKQRHHWESGWLAEAARLLLASEEN